MRLIVCVTATWLVLVAGILSSQALPGTLVAVFAHPDDEVPVGPVLARYARDGAQVYLVVATDGAQGGANTAIPRGPELARVRNEELQCAANALGARQPILLGFPDGGLGDYTAEPGRLVRLTQRLHAELQRLRPDALIVWGPDGGPPHPDHKLVSNVVTQLVRAGAPGVTTRLFYSYIPIEGFRALNPTRAEPPFAMPLAQYFTVRVPFAAADLDAARRAMACHRTQFTEDQVQRVTDASRQAWSGVLPLVPLDSAISGADLFRSQP
jgi:LmbE family N-acetylglucosaminyl deacetylase